MSQGNYSKLLIGAIIQARLTSSRFPRKILEEINGVPILEHLVRRVHLAKTIDKLIIASPHNPECCLNETIYIGSEYDVLDRYYQAAKDFNLDVVVRLTSDCPLLPPFEVDRVVKCFLENGSDYITNRPSVLDGWDVEVFTFKALEKAWIEATLPYDREHVTPYMQEDSSLKRAFLEQPKLSLDNHEDLIRIKEFYVSERQAFVADGWDGQLRTQLHSTSTFHA